MKAVVVYESMYGNTHLIADAIAAGLRDVAEVVVVPVGQADHELIAGADLVVVGGPTHAHGMTKAGTRAAAVDAAHRPGNEVPLDPDAEGEGLREWFDTVDEIRVRAAAFDTRFDGPAVLTGRASKGIARQLREHGFDVVAPPESFFVTHDNHLTDNEEVRARQWGAELAAAAKPSSDETGARSIT